MRFYFDWMLDHRFTDFLKAKRDLFLYEPDAVALAEFQRAIREILARIDQDLTVVGPDAQRAFFLRRFAQELEPLLALGPGLELPAPIERVQESLTRIQDQVRAYSR